MSHNTDLPPAQAEADGQLGLPWHEKARGPCSKDRKHTARLGYTANCLRTAAAELPTLSTAFCSSSLETPSALVQYLTSKSSCMLILLRSRWSRLVRLSLMF